MSEHAAPQRILVTGFAPFGGEPLNASWEVARALDGAQLAGASVHALQLPCVFGEAERVLYAALVQVQPTLVVCLGQASGRAQMTPERVAINLDDARIPDNAGQQPIDVPVVAGAPAAYFSTLPIKAMVRAMLEAGVPAAVSNTAGTYVCNHVFYALMHRLARRAAPGVRGGLVHVPALPEQVPAGAPSVALATQVHGLRLALQAALATHTDLAQSAGQLH